MRWNLWGLTNVLETSILYFQIEYLICFLTKMFPWFWGQNSIFIIKIDGTFLSVWV